MSYTPTVWQEKITPLGPTNMNKLEAGVAAAQNSQTGDLTLISNEASSGSGDIVLKTGASERMRFHASGGIDIEDFAVFGNGVPANTTLATFKPVLRNSGTQLNGVYINPVGKGNAGQTGNGLFGLTVNMQDDPAVANRTITGCANNGSGLIRVTATAHGFATGDRLGIYGVTGTTEANGAWVITVIDSNHFDLQGSTFAHAYVSGGTATNRSYMLPIYVGIAPLSDRGGFPAGPNSNADDFPGIAFQNVGSDAAHGNPQGAKASECVYIASSGSISGSAWQTGFACDANVDWGMTLGNNGASLANGGIDLSKAAYPGGSVAIRLPSNVSVSARNNANNADIQLFKLDANDFLQFEVGTMSFVDGLNIVVGSTVGTRISYFSTGKLGFWGATPIVQPSAVGSSAGYSAGTTAGTFHTDDKYTGNVGSTAYTMNGIVAALKNSGLIAM